MSLRKFKQSVVLIPVPYQFFGARCAVRRARRAPGRERGVYDFIYGALGC